MLLCFCFAKVSEQAIGKFAFTNAAFTAKNNLTSPNILVGKLYGRAQFPHSFGQLARNYVETVLLQNCHITKFGEITAYHGDFLKNFMRKL